MARRGDDGGRGRLRGWAEAVLAVVFLLVGPMALADWAVHRDDPFVAGTFVRTSDPCGRFDRRCREQGRWSAADGMVRDDVWLEGAAGESGRTRAVYRGGLPVPADPDAVWTQEALDEEPWLYLGMTALGPVLVASWWWDRRRRPPGGARRGGRPPGAHRQAAGAPSE